MVDLHVHFPMHLGAESALEQMTRVRRRPRLIDKLRAVVLSIAARLANFRRFDGTWRADLPALEAGKLEVVLSVLYSPFSELDLAEPYGAPPRSAYYGELLRQLEQVEDEVGDRMVHDGEQLETALRERRMAFVHCVEGGFHLGATPAEVDANVTELARKGIAYITLAHLFWRQVAADAPAIPFLSDRLYELLFPQRKVPGLTDLGRAAIRAMHREGVLVDITHMRADAVKETFALVEELDASNDPKRYPVIASHVGYRFGSQRYDVEDATVRRIAARDGVIGLLLAQHQLNDGLPDVHGMETVFRHIDALHKVTGSYAHIAIGTDFDGFIKPTVEGLESAADLPRLETALRDRYPADAEAMLRENALRILRRRFS
jgi:microsomal dipeptidase-like Zn-dependent dipeptidase